MRITWLFAFVITFFFASNSFSQRPKIELYITVSIENADGSTTPIEEAFVEIYEDGKLFLTQTTGSNGKIPTVQLDINHHYLIYFVNEGYVTKICEMDTDYKKTDDLMPVTGQEMQISLFKEVEGIDLTFMEKEPIIKFAFKPNGTFTWDSKHKEMMFEKVTKIRNG